MNFNLNVFFAYAQILLATRQNKNLVSHFHFQGIIGLKCEMKLIRKHNSHNCYQLSAWNNIPGILYPNILTSTLNLIPEIIDTSEVR